MCNAADFRHSTYYKTNRAFTPGGGRVSKEVLYFLSEPASLAGERRRHILGGVGVRIKLGVCELHNDVMIWSSGIQNVSVDPASNF